MSERMIRRLDTIIAYVRWLALLGVPIVALASTDARVDGSLTFLLIALGMAVIDAVPVTMLAFKFFPQAAAWAFLILDTLFTLVLLYLGGPGMFFYAFVPALAMSVRFDWMIGLGDSVVLALGHVLIALFRAGFGSIADVMTETLGMAVLLVAASALVGLMAETTKKEPPFVAEEQKQINDKMARLQAAADRARAIYDMASTLSATLNYDKILNAVLEVSMLGFKELVSGPSGIAEKPSGVVLLIDEDILGVGASYNIGYEEAGLVVGASSGLVGRVLRTRTPLIAGNLAQDPDLGQFKAFKRCRSSICVPLRAGFDTYGVVVFASPVADAFSEEHLELVMAIANQAAVALSNARLYEDLQDEKERIIGIHEDERNKLSRDLHDGPTQSVSAIAMRLNFARLLLDRDPVKVKDELFKLENLARRTTKEIRTMLFTLRPVVLETQGLKAAIEQLVEKLIEATEGGELPITLEIAADVEAKIDVNIKAVAWFIAQESLNNVRKYAQAEHIWVRVYIRDAYFITEIEDNGVGFSVDEIMSNYEQRGSYGLMNLQERADLVNGRTIIRSEVGKGTKITLVVPLNREVI
ncbi:MAG: GAF domain-containing sensor histidine kinase [Anaerolineae bacterium]|nr:GAF domain-containing sensor histidine kinase [Anaerolineae bacterium]